MSDSARWLELERLYHAALERPAAERASFVEQACSHDEWLRRELESLLTNDQTDTYFLDKRAISIAADELTGTRIEASPIEAGSLVGAYKILEQLAHGGMGVVYRAEQQYPVRRIVALKVIKPGMDSEQVVARFQAERQALALMDHPNIARVLDAGTTSTGRLYFVMEFVDGLPVTEYCQKHELSLRERLALFIPVCQAIQHAHQKGVIHRDIKPSNILVTVYDGEPVPKVIDFGIAKAMHEPLTERSMHTQAGALVGTFEYMSPEQAGSFGEDIDTRSDVYALGVVLYELIAGSTPLNRLSLEKASAVEIVRRIREEDPPPPSVRIRDTKLSRTVRGDLDWVVLKALEKDRSRRYETVNGLARDLQRYLAGEPVEAAPPSAWYRMRKFARRHRAGLLTAAAFATLLIAGVVVSSRMAIRASRAEQEAEAVNDFLQNDLLAQASAFSQERRAKPDPHLEVRTALDRAAGRIAGKFDRQPAVEAAIRDTIGQTYASIGLLPEARKQLERALELHRRIAGPEKPETLKTMSRLGQVADLQGKYPEAEASLSQAAALQRRVLGPAHPDTLNSMGNLAYVYYRQGKYAQAEALYSQTLDARRRVLGAEHPDTLSSESGLAIVYYSQGKYAQAEVLDKEVVEIERRVLGPEHPQTLQAMAVLAYIYYWQKKYAPAEALFSQTVESMRRVLGVEHSTTLEVRNNLGNVYEAEGKYAQAEALYSQNLEIQRRVLGVEHSDTLYSMNNLADTYCLQGKYAQGQALLNETVAIERRALGPNHPQTLMSMSNLADAYAFQGDYARAEALLGQTVEISRRSLGQEDPLVLAILADYGTLYQRQGKYAVAETHAAEVLALRRHALGSDNPDTVVSAADLALTYQSEGKFGQSEPLAREAFDFYNKKQPDDWHRFRAESLLGAILSGERKYAEAEPLLLTGFQGMVARKAQISVPDQYYVDRAREWIVQFYQASGKPEKAAEWRKK